MSPSGFSFVAGTPPPAKQRFAAPQITRPSVIAADSPILPPTRIGSSDALLPPPVVAEGPKTHTIAMPVPAPDEARRGRIQKLNKFNMIAVPVLVSLNVLLIVYVWVILLGGQVGSASDLNMLNVMHVAKSGNVGINRPDPVVPMEVASQPDFFFFTFICLLTLPLGYWSTVDERQHDAHRYNVRR